MLKEERQNHILQRLSKFNKVLSSELSLDLNVSEDTIRRDLKELSDLNLLKKVHGGAIINSHNPFHYRDREVYALEQKLQIVRKALPIIEDGKVIIIDGGTTNLELVKIFPKDLKATIITNSIPIAVHLSNHPNIEVFFLGGKMLKEAQVTIGIDVINSLSNIHADLAFLGTRSIDIEMGVTEIDLEETHVKRAILKAANNVACLVISEKINTIQPYMVGGLQSINYLITELDVNESILQPYRRNGIVIF